MKSWAELRSQASTQGKTIRKAPIPIVSVARSHRSQRRRGRAGAASVSETV